MWPVPNLPDWFRAVLALVGYSVLFGQIIRRNRMNRPVVLGVCTVIMFAGFLMVVTLRGQPWLHAVVMTATIGLGICVLFFVGQDVARWAIRQGSSEGDASVKRSEAPKRQG